jgi:hypothetical protein
VFCVLLCKTRSDQNLTSEVDMLRSLKTQSKIHRRGRNAQEYTLTFANPQTVAQMENIATAESQSLAQQVGNGDVFISWIDTDGIIRSSRKGTAGLAIDLYHEDQYYYDSDDEDQLMGTSMIIYYVPTVAQPALPMGQFAD